VRHRPIGTHHQLTLGVNGVIAVAHRHFEEVGHRDRLGRARLDAHRTEDATQHVDLIHEPEPFAGAYRIVDRIVLTTDVNASRRAHTGAQFATDALLHAIGVAIEHVTTMEPLRLDALLFGVLGGQLSLEHLTQRHCEPGNRIEEAH